MATKVLLTALSITPAPVLAVDKEGNVEVDGVVSVDPVIIGNAFLAYAAALAGNQNKVRAWTPELIKTTTTTK